MKKFLKIAIICLLIAAFSVTLFACKPPEESSEQSVRDNYLGDATVLADLTDYSGGTTPTTYAQDSINTATGRLNTKINSLNTEYHADTLTALQKILKNSSASEIVAAFAYSGLPMAQMLSLTEYISNDSDPDKPVKKAKDVPAEATGLIEDYNALSDWDKELESLTKGSPEYNNVYKNRALKSYAVNARLIKTGMNGGMASRALIEVLQYMQTVVNGANMANGGDMTAYFKDVLYTKVYDTSDVLDGGKYTKLATFSYDASAYNTLVLLRTFNHIRWGSEGRTTSYVLKSGSYSRNATTDNYLIKAWGYMYDYEMATHKSITQDEYNANIEYSLAASLSNEDAVKAAAIERKLYIGGYRYSADFYVNKYYPAVEIISANQELYEACVYGFVSDTTDSWNGNITGNAGITYTAEGNVNTESTITFQAGAVTEKYTATFTTGVKAGMAASLLASDMEYYYLTNEIVTAQATAQRTMEENKGDTASQAYINAKFDLEMLNLKMSNYVMSQFLIAETGNTELISLLQYQIYNYQSDYIRSIKQLKQDIVLDIQQLVGEGVYAESTGYTLSRTATADENAVIYDVGYNSALLRGMVSNFQGLGIATQISNANNVVWADVNQNVKDTIDADYSAAQNKVNALEDNLIKKKKKDPQTGQTYTEAEAAALSSDIQGRLEDTYDEGHALSRLLYNHESVMYYTSGQVQISLRKATALGSNTTLALNSGATLVTGATLVGEYNARLSDFGSDYRKMENFQGNSFTKESNTYTSNGKWYLLYFYDGVSNVNYYYEVTGNSSFKYDTTLYLGYTRG